MTTPRWRARHVPGSPEYLLRTSQESEQAARIQAATSEVHLRAHEYLRITLDNGSAISVAGDGSVAMNGTPLYGPATA